MLSIFTFSLYSVLHQLVHPLLVDDQGRTELPSLHQLFKALKELSITSGSCRDADFFVFFCSLYFICAHLSSVRDQRGDLTFDWQVCSILQAVMEKDRVSGWVKRQNIEERMRDLFLRKRRVISSRCSSVEERSEISESELCIPKTQPVISPLSRNGHVLEENR